jgi:biotin carboxylase
MSESRQLTVLCLAGDEKGQSFIRECKARGARVFLLTRQALAQANWPREAIDDCFYLPTLTNVEDVIKGVSYLCRTQTIDRVIPLDDFDVEIAARLREHLRIPGMGDTTAHYFRDKLAMRMRAREEALLVPDFVHVLNYEAIRRFLARVPAPWMLKPRSQAAAAGINKIWRAEDLWSRLNELGDEQSHYLLEQFVPGDIYHVDAIVSEREVVFVEVNRYGQPPLDLVQAGGIFVTQTVAHQTAEEEALSELNRQLIAALGFVRGVTHTEFIRSREDGRFYFLETAARVGGAHIAEVVEAASGINLWREWAKIELADGAPYQIPSRRRDYAGIVLCLARQEEPDTSAYDDAEIVWRLKRHHHAGLIFKAAEEARISQLIASYSRRFAEDFLATQPALDKMPR